MINNNQKKDATQKAFRYLAIKDRTEKEILYFLQKKGYAKALVEEIITDLKRMNYLDDEKFAYRWAKDRFWSKGFGPAKIKRDMIAKGIERYMPHFTSSEEIELIHSLLKKYLPRNFCSSDYKLYCKAGNYLYRRGFSEENIRYVLKDIFAF